MKHCAKKLLGLAFALALCLAVGGTAFAAQVPEFADVPAALPEQEMLAFEPNVAAEPGTNSTGNLERDGYTVIIPTTVTVDSKDNKGELTVTAQLKRWRTLNIGIESKKNNWKLAYDGATDADMPKVDYTLKNENENGGEFTRDTIWHYDESTHEIMYATSAIENVHTATIPLSVNVTDPSQATMSGTYSDTLTFTFNLTKQSVTYTINVYEQKLQLTNSGTHVQAVNVVDASGNVTDTTSAPKETYVLEYGCADAWGTPLATVVTTDTWTRPRTGHDVSEEEDTRCWEDLSRTLTPKADFEANNKTQTINLNLVRKWYWLDVNGITDKSNCADCKKDGNQGSKIAGFVNIKVSVDDGANWSDWFWCPGGDDYWGTFPYGTEFQLGLHRVKDGYAYDADADGNVAIYANGNVEYTQDDTVTSPDGKTHYRVYQGKLEGEPVDKTLHDTKWGGNYHKEGSYQRYCYNPCYVDGITYYANDDGCGGGREDTNLYHGPHTTFKYTAGMTLAEPETTIGCNFTAPAGKVFAGWSTTKDYTGQKLYGVGDPVSSVTWPTRPTVSNNDTLPDKDSQTECRTLYAIWGYKTDIKIAFEDGLGTTDKNALGVFETVQKGNFVDEYTLKTDKIVIPGQTLTLDLNDSDVKAAITAGTDAVKRDPLYNGVVVTDDKIWDLAQTYTITVPQNKTATLRFEILRKRYLLNVMAVLAPNGTLVTLPTDAATPAKYGTFCVNCNGRYQTVGGKSKFSVYQLLRNYGSTYEVCKVEANPGYQFVKFMKPAGQGVTTAGDSTHATGILTGKNENLSYFGGDSKTYTGDTIYVVFKPDMVTFDFNGGTTKDGETSTKERYNPGAFIPQMSYNSPGTSSLQGWSLNKEKQPNETIYKPDSTRLGDISWPDPENKVLYARWSTGPNRAPAKKVLTVRYHANFDPMEELALDLDPNPLLDDMDEDFGFEPEPLPEDVLDPTVDAVKTVTYKPDENVVLRHCMFKRAGYVFVGWNTEPDGTGKKYEVNGVPITDWAAGATVDLYAQWEKPHHLKPVDDSAPQLGGADATPTPQPGGADAAPAPQPGGVDDAFGIDPHLGGMDDAFGVDPAAQPEGLDDAFGVDPADQPKALDDAFGVDPDPQPEELDDAFGV